MLVSKPNFSSILCYAIETPEHKQRTLKPSSQLLPNMSRVLKLNKVQEVNGCFLLEHESKAGGFFKSLRQAISHHTFLVSNYWYYTFSTYCK